MLIAFYISIILFCLIVATVILLLFGNVIDNVITRLAPKELSITFSRLFKFSVYIFCLGGGFSIYRLADIKESDLTHNRIIMEYINAAISSFTSSVPWIVILLMIALAAIGIINVIEKYINLRIKSTNITKEKYSRPTRRSSQRGKAR